MAIQRSSILVSLLLMLAACGGGGGGSSGGTPNGNSPPPASPTAEELTKAQNAKLRMRLDVPNLLLVSWVDTFDNEQSYIVERRAANGAWQTVATVPAFDGGSGSWEGSILNNPGTYRVSATFRDYSLPLHAEPGVSEIEIDAVAMTLEVVTAPEPTGGLRASVRNASPAQSVTYFASGAQLANVTSGDDFATTVPFQRLLPLGLVAAEVHKSAGLTLRAHTPLPPASHNEAALVLTVGPSPTSAALLLTARAYSHAGIASVQFFANGQLLQRLDSPDRLDNWIHAIDPASLTSNVNTFRALATDADGATVSMDVEHTLETLPALTVEGLFDGMIASGDRLNIRGTFGENVPGTVLSIDAGYRNPVFRTRTSPFNFDYPIAGLSSWREMTIRAESPTGQVSTRTYFVVLPSTGRSYELIATDAARLLAADAGVLLYQKRSGAVVMRDAAGVETPFQVPTGLNFSAWYLANGKVIAQERINHRMHAFVGPGQTVDLLPWWIGRYASSAPPVLRGDWLAFTPGIGFAVYNLTTGATTHMEPPAGTLYLSYDIDTTAGNERLLFPADIDGTRGIYSHSFVTDTTELLATGAYDAVRTDGARLVARSETAVLVGPLNNPAAMTTLSNRPSDIVMKDGWLCYRDDSSRLAVDDGMSTVQLSETGSCDERSIADGRLVFVDGKGINSWSPTAGKQLVLDASAPMVHTQGVAYLLTGRDGALYRTTLP